MAGAGYKLFNTGDVLTAAQVNTYLQEQSVMVFASAAARTTALSGVLAEGMMSYLQDTNAVEVYNGTAWVGVSSAGDITEVTTAANSGLAGGATSGAVALKLNTAAKGDLLVGTGSLTSSVLTVGANNTILTADSTTGTGLKWATASAAGQNWTLQNAGGTALTGAATITVSGISAKNSIMVILTNASSASAGSTFGIRLNTLSTNIYNYFGQEFLIQSTYATNSFAQVDGGSQPYVALASMSSNVGSTAACGITFTGCNASGVKQFIGTGAASAATSNSQMNRNVQGWVDTSASITSVSAFSSVGNFDSGTMYVYTSA